MRFGERLARIGIAAAALSGFAALCTPAPALAQDPSAMSCDELWYARNEIYARRGYCFQTERAQATFGRGCFPPYGELGGWERERVNMLQMWERRKGC